MDDPLLFAIIAAAGVGIVATLLILRRQDSEQADENRENPYAVSRRHEALPVVRVRQPGDRFHLLELQEAPPRLNGMW